MDGRLYLRLDRRRLALRRRRDKRFAFALTLLTCSGGASSAPSRRLLGKRLPGKGSMKAEMTAQLVADALMMAIWRRGKPDALLHHCDQGSQ